MTKTLADGVDGDVLTLRHTRPTVTRHVGGERCFQTNHPAYALQVAVLPVQGVLVLRPLVCAVLFYYGQEIDCVCLPELFEKLLHGLLPFYLHQLTCLLPSVGQHASHQVALS